MGLARPLVVLLLQCRSILCPHPVNVLSLWCFYRESLLLLRFLFFSFFKSEKTASSPQKQLPQKTITDTDYADDIAILANTPNQAEILLHSLERAATGIDLHVNAHKTEYMCFNQAGDVSTLEGTSLKLVDKFAYLGHSVSSTENDIDTWLTKAWTAIDRLSIIWK